MTITPSYSQIIFWPPARWMRFLHLLLLVNLLGLLPISAIAAPATISLSDTHPRVEVWPAVTILPDPDKKMTIAEVMTLTGSFTPPQLADNTLGMRKDAVWLHIPLSLSGKNDADWVLDIDYAVINRIDMYLVNKKVIVQKATLGNLQAREERSIKGRVHSEELALIAGEQYDLFLRVENVGSMILPITLNSHSAFHAKSLNEQMLQGLLTGLALCLLIYSLTQWISLRDPLFVKYALLILGGLLFSLLQFGVGAQYVWFENFWMETHIGGVSALMAIAGTFLFIEQVLAGPELPLWLGKLMKLGAGVVLFFALCFCLDWIDIHTVTAIVSTIGLLPTILGTPGAIKRARKGDAVGAYFLVAWTVYFITTAIMIEVIKGHLPANFWTMHSFQFGATFDMLVFMRVLGLRSVDLQTAVNHATHERDTMHSMAHSDPLTGLPNRRSLNATITTAIKETSADNILAIYMLDLDGFKQVNDQYGHDTGDELLIAVAARLKGCLRSRDLVSRLGGDEFVVMSSGLDSAEQAREIGDKLLQAFSYAFILSEQTCKIGLTIGYALAPLDGRDTLSLLKRADAAMYAGKQDGKNCVLRSEASAVLN